MMLLTPLWRCFHCDEVFSDEEAARLHFGSSFASVPACQVDAAQLRELERELERYREEDTDLHREIHRQQWLRLDAVRRAEELGYSRGLADAKKEGLC